MSVPLEYISQMQVFKETEQQYIINNTPPGQPIPTFDPDQPDDLLTGAHATVADMLGQDVWTAQQQAYASRATGSWLDLKAADFSIYRKQAIAASGNFTFATNVPATSDLPIAQGTIITTAPTAGVGAVQYSTTQVATIPAGQSNVTVPAVCTQGGTLGNLTTATQLLIGSTAPQGVDSVSLAAAITNGVDAELDDALRSRLLNAPKAQAFGSAAWYIGQVTTISDISTATVVTGTTQPNDVDIYISGPNNTIPTSAVIASAQALFAGNSGKPQIDNPIVLAGSALALDITVSVTAAPGADEATVTQNVLNALTTFANSVPLGALGTATINGIQAQFTGTIYPSQINAQVLAQLSVLDAGSVMINGSASPLTLTASQLTQAGTITPSVTIA